MHARTHARTSAYALSTLGRARARACRSPHADSCRADPAAGAGASVDRAVVGIAVGIAGRQRHARAIQAGLRVLLHAPVRPAPREYSECAACWRVGYQHQARVLRFTHWAARPLHSRSFISSRGHAWLRWPEKRPWMNAAPILAPTNGTGPIRRTPSAASSTLRRALRRL